MASVSRSLLTSTRRLAAISRLSTLSTRSISSWKNWNVYSGRAIQFQFSKPSAVASNPIVKRWYSSDTSMSVEELTKTVLDVLKMFDKVDQTKVTVDAHFTNDLGLDSLDVVEVVMAFEDEFGVEISDDEAEKIFNCKDAIELLKVKLDIE